MGLRLAVDMTLCAGHGMCALVAADVVDLDAWGFAHVSTGDVDPRFVAQARRAVRACPRRALSLRETRDA